MRPEAKTRRKSGLVIILVLMVAAGGALAAISTDFTSKDRKAETDSVTQSSAAVNKARKGSLTPAPGKFDEKQQLERAYRAVFGTSQVTGVDSGDYVYSGGKVLHDAEGGLILIAPADHKEAYPVNMGALGIYYLAERDGELVVKGRWPDIVGGSIMGNPPEWDLRTDLTDFPVIVSTAGGVWQGYMCQNTTLTELRPGAPITIADFASVYSDGGAKAEGEPSTDLEGKIGASVRNVHFDVNFEGTRSFVQRYVLGAGGKFAVEPGSESVPTC